MKTQAQVIETLKAFALANYNNGYDTFVECYDNAEWVELLNDVNGSEEEALSLMANLASIFSERQADSAYYQDVADAEYTATIVADKAADEAQEDAEAAQEWEREMAAIRHAESGGYNGYNETDYMYDEHNF